MVARCVNRVHLHRLVTGVDDVVPHTSRNLHRPAVGDLLLDRHVVLIRSHDALANTRVQTQELVGIVVHLQADGIARGDRHEGHLQVLARPRGGSVVRVLSGGRFNVKDIGFWSVVDDLHGSPSGEMSSISHARPFSREIQARPPAPIRAHPRAHPRPSARGPAKRRAATGKPTEYSRTSG